MNLLHYGLQRSGTNFLQALLNKKYRVRFLNKKKDYRSPLQKHFRLYDNKDIVPVSQYRNDIGVKDFEEFEQLFEIVPNYYLIISKDPYSWFLSYSNWAKKCNWAAATHHYIEEYNLFYGKWLQFSHQTDKIIFIKYIELLRNTNLELHRLEGKMNLQKKLLANLFSSEVDKVPQSSSFTNERQAYYINELYLKKYSLAALQTLNRHLDSQVISLLGYEKRVMAK